jgi:RND family efflux transporter MFP subunit
VKLTAAPLLLALALLAACGRQEAPPPAVPPAPTFTQVPLAALAIYPERRAPAAAIGKNEARISAEVAARILALPVDVGQTITHGTVVARLDSQDAELALERAEAALAQVGARHAQARAQLERARALREKNFYSAEALTLRETELAATAADLRAATAQRATAQHALAKHTLRAPFDAIVRTRSGQVGELAAPGTILLTLVDAREVELAAHLQPHDVVSLADHAAAPVSPPPTFIANGQQHALKLLRISPTPNRESRSVEARFGFIDAAPPAGTEGRLVWREIQPWLPADLLVRRADRYGVFIVQAGKARFHPLADAQEGRPAQLDLPLETLIVTQGRHALQDGMAVQ